MAGKGSRGVRMRTPTGGIGSEGLTVPNGHQTGVPGGLVPSGRVLVGIGVGVDHVLGNLAPVHVSQERERVVARNAFARQFD